MEKIQPAPRRRRKRENSFTPRTKPRSNMFLRKRRLAARTTHAAGLEASPPSPPFFSNFVSLFSLSLYQLALSASLSPAYVREKQERPKNSSETDRRERLFPLSVRPLPVILVKTLRLARGQAARGSAIRGWPSNHPRAPREGEKILSFSGSIGYFRFLGLSRSWIAVLSERKRGGSGDFRS